MTSLPLPLHGCCFLPQTPEQQRAPRSDLVGTTLTARAIKGMHSSHEVCVRAIYVGWECRWAGEGKAGRWGPPSLPGQ